jgi:hypothetical protein
MNRTSASALLAVGVILAGCGSGSKGDAASDPAVQKYAGVVAAHKAKLIEVDAQMKACAGIVSQKCGVTAVDALASADAFETDFKAAGNGTPPDSIATLVADTISAADGVATAGNSSVGLSIAHLSSVSIAVDHLVAELNAWKKYGG